MNDKIEIPEELQEVCKAIAKVAKEYKLTNLSGKFSPDYGSRWRDDVHFNWTSGRHGAESNTLRISSQVWVVTDVETTDSKEAAR